MKFTAISSLIAGLLLSFTSAADPAPVPDLHKERKIYIVQLAEKPLAAYRAQLPSLAAAQPRASGRIDPQSAEFRRYSAFLRSRRNEVLSSISGARKIHDYEVVFNGFAAQMTGKQAEQLRARKDVLGVWEDELLKPQTDSTPDFLGLTGVFGPWLWGFTGEDVVVGVIDSGIHPEHPSVADMPTHKRGNRGRKMPYGPAPEDFTGAGCDFGNTAFNPDDAPFDCNNKLLKAKSFSESFLSLNTLADYEFLSARDADGHGTHTATTAAGNYGVESSLGGTVSGMAPRARLAVYKVCWDAPDPDDSGCFSSDSMAAIDQAVADGVDVINFSVGGSSTAFTGPDDLAFLYATDAGVFVSVSGGNSGPESETIGTPSGAPWVTSVAAAEDNQNFGTGLQLDVPAEVATIYEGLEGSGPVTLADSGAISSDVVAAEPLEACSTLTNASAIEGQIALVIRGACSFTEKYDYAAAAGARAIVVYNDGTAADRIDPIVMSAPETTIPGIMIRHPDGELIASTTDTAGTLSPEIQVPREDRITGFSSRGPNSGAPDIIKPDVAAPGVGIIAGTSPVSSGGNLFAALSGTSMASPHVAGVMALLKQAHPDWTPAIAKSALMTTARVDLQKSFGPEAADPFDMGAGAIEPGGAMVPGLVYNAGFYDYLAFFCGAERQSPPFDPSLCASLEEAGYSLDPSDLNLASIGIGSLIGTETVTRTVTSVLPGTHHFWASVDAPAGIDVSVSPAVIRLAEGESATYRITFSTTADTTFGEWSFGALTWKSFGNFIQVRSPIAVNPTPMAAPGQLQSSGTDGSLSFNVDFGYEGPYEVSIAGLAEAQTTVSAVEDGSKDEIFFELAPGKNLLRLALYDENVGAGDGSDDIDMELLYLLDSDFVLIGASGSPTSEESIDIANPPPGQYKVVVKDFATAAGATPYTLFNYAIGNEDTGNTAIDAPENSNPGGSGTVTVNWFDLSPGTRALGILEHSDGGAPLAQTEVMIDTQ